MFLPNISVFWRAYFSCFDSCCCCWGNFHKRTTIRAVDLRNLNVRVCSYFCLPYLLHSYLVAPDYGGHYDPCWFLSPHHPRRVLSDPRWRFWSSHRPCRLVDNTIAKEERKNIKQKIVNKCFVKLIQK